MAEDWLADVRKYAADAETTDTSGDNLNARRVEVVVQ